MTVCFLCSYCEDSLSEPVSTLLWVAPRLSAEIQELAVVCVCVYVCVCVCVCVCLFVCLSVNVLYLISMF